MPELSASDVRSQVVEWAKANWNPDETVGQWWAKLSAAGYALPVLPESVGGKGYARDLAMAVNAGLAEAEVLGPPFGLGTMLAAPTIAAHGSVEQQQQFIPGILNGQDAWCQLFSEPGAGSDLAGLQTKAIRDGDEWIITGQKVWTSGGQIARWGMLLARTDTEVPKHQGITYFAFDMDQPGVVVRPLREMTGRAMFNEVFIDEARVPHANIIGGLNNGWAVANTTLMVERASIGAGGTAGLSQATPGAIAGQLNKRAGDFVTGRSGNTSGSSAGTLKLLRKLAKELGRDQEAVIRQGLAELHILSEISRLNTARARSRQNLTGVEGNLAKMLLTHTLRRSRDIANEIIGPHGTLWGPESLTRGMIQEMTVFSPGPAIYGGTDQIQRNIAAERGLGLPKEPGPDKNTPFAALAKN